MADYEAPTGPPPPKVPEGWIVKWNEQYKEWFYVNSYTRKSQWDKPTAPAPRPDDVDGPDGPPPSYTPGKNPTAVSDTKSAAGTTNPFEANKTGGSSSTQQEEEDARLARQMQEEENARAHSPQPGSGAAASYASTPVPGSGSGPYGGSDPQLPPRPDDPRGGGSRGLLGKLFGKNKTSQQQQYGGGYPGQQQPYGGGYGSPQPQYGAYPPQGYGGPGYGGYGPGPGYGGPPPGGYYGGGYPQQQQAQPGRTGGGGLGMAGGAALGLGGGLIGGMLLENAIDHHDQQIYNEGYQNGDMGDGGGDYGGDGGGDYGGDGGGDFGGGGDF